MSDENFPPDWCHPCGARRRDARNGKCPRHPEGDDDPVIMLPVPPVPGKPDGAALICAALEVVVEVLDGNVPAIASILLTSGLSSVQQIGMPRAEVERLLAVELDRVYGASPPRRRVAPGRPRRVRFGP
jgi:hypothetical protein